MWRLYWHITNGYWRDDFQTPKDILELWFNIPHIIKSYKDKNFKLYIKLIAIFYIILTMFILEPLQFVVYYTLLPFQIFSEWFCAWGRLEDW